MILPKGIEIKSSKAKPDDNGNMILNVAGVCWFTNLDHGKRHQQLQLDTMAHNLKFNKKLKKKFEKDYGKLEYPHYDNYDAIEVPFVEAIPSDYDGVMGVPITFMDKYSPEQFEIVGGTANGQVPNATKIGHYRTYNNPVIGGRKVYQRILVRNKHPEL